jgi:hypothetical protein
MKELRVRFTAANRLDRNAVAFRVQLTQEGQLVSGVVHVKDPEKPYPPMMFTETILASGKEVTWATMAALSGPLKSALSLGVGEAMPADIEAIVSEDPPPGPGYSAIRVMWSDPSAEGIIVTLKDPPRAPEHHDDAAVREAHGRSGHERSGTERGSGHMKAAWNRHAAWGAYFGLVIGASALMNGVLGFVAPGTGLAELIAPEPGALQSAVTLLMNAVACSLIWAGIRSSGRWRWFIRAGAVVLYIGLVALTLNRFRFGV